jgi:hypothetical protein
MRIPSRRSAAIDAVIAVLAVVAIITTDDDFLRLLCGAIALVSACLAVLEWRRVG